MKRKIAVFLVILLLFLGQGQKAKATSCTCISNGVDCVEKIPTKCKPSEICNCAADRVIIDPNSGAIGCATGGAACITKPTLIPTPTGDISKYGTCKGGYQDITGKCSVTTNNCVRGSEPKFSSPDCTGPCWCAASDQISQTPQEIDIQGKCQNKDEVDTALGCIPTGNFNNFVVWVLKRAMAISGGIAFLLMIFGGFRVLVSAGNPKGVQAGNEMITSALMGLLFIIFSVFLLQLIGVKILELPGL